MHMLSFWFLIFKMLHGGKKIGAAVWRFNVGFSTKTGWDPYLMTMDLNLHLLYCTWGVLAFLSFFTCVCWGRRGVYKFNKKNISNLDPWVYVRYTGSFWRLDTGDVGPASWISLAPPAPSWSDPSERNALCAWCQCPPSLSLCCQNNVNTHTIPTSLASDSVALRPLSSSLPTNNGPLCLCKWPLGCGYSIINTGTGRVEGKWRCQASRQRACTYRTIVWLRR